MLITTFLIDLTDLTYSSSPDSTSVIGKALTSASYFYETATATNGVIYNIELGERAVITKINFLGNKVYKDRKLRNLITSEESKFWKFV